MFLAYFDTKKYIKAKLTFHPQKQNFSTSKTARFAQTVENLHNFFIVSYAWYKSLHHAHVSTEGDFLMKMRRSCNIFNLRLILR